MLGVYIHIPFCEKKCNYCAFSSFARLGEKQKYISSLVQEIGGYKGENKVDTIYIGGGTPSLLSNDELGQILNALKEKFSIEKDSEITIECNPNSLSEEKLKFYKENGVNRISIGVQRLNDEKLKILGRLHNYSQALQTIDLAKKYFENVSVDFIIGLQDEWEQYEKEIEKLIEEKVKHISVYMLQVEEKTPLQKMVLKNPGLILEDEEYVEIYEKMVKKLKKNGFFQYEVSNFAQKGFESKHNFKYWSGENYIGFGLSAHSYIDGVRFANASNFDDYYKRKIELKEVLTDKQKVEEHIMLGLRCRNGIDKNFIKSFGYDIEKNKNYNDYLSQNILIESGDKVFLNPDYYSVNNLVIVNLLE